MGGPAGRSALLPPRAAFQSHSRTPRHSMRAVIVAVLPIAFAGPALAASPEEALVTGWIETMASGAPVGVGSSGWDPARQAVDLENVTIGKPGDALVVTVGQVSFESPRNNGRGILAVRAVRASDLKVQLHFDPARWFPALVELDKKQKSEQSGPGDAPGDGIEGEIVGEIEATDFRPVDVTVDYGTVLIERAEFPLAAPVLAADATFVSGFLTIVRWTLGFRMDWFEASEVTSTTKGMPDIESTVEYGRVYGAGLHDGRMERIGVENYHQAAPITPDEVADMTIERAEAIGIDNRAMLDAIDPKTGPDGKGDGIWRPVVERLVYEDFAFVGPDTAPFRITIDRMDYAGARMRPVGKPLFAVLETMLKDPAKLENEDAGLAFARDIIPAAFGLYGLDSGTITGVSVAAGGVFEGSVGVIEATRMDSDGVGAVTLRDLAGKVRAASSGEQDGQAVGAELGSGSLALVTLNDVRFGSLDPWIALGGAEQSDDPPKPGLMRDAILDGLPTVGQFELAGLAVSSPELTFSLDGYTSTGGDYLRQLQRRMDLTITGLAYPVASIPDPTTRQQLEEMGYDRVDLSAAVTTRWDTDKGEFHLDDLTVSGADMGVLSADVHVGNVPLSLLDNPETLEQRLQEATIVSASTLFANQSLVERIFKVQAKPLNQDPDQFRKNFGASMPLMLGFLGDKDIQKTFAGALKTFFEDPKSIRVSAKPAAPVPVAAFEGIEATPGAALKLLGLSVEANR